MDLQLALQYKKKFFPNVSVGFAAACPRSNAEQMRFHNRVSPSQQFHADSRSCFENFSSLGAHQMFVRLGGVVKIEYGGFVVAGKPAQRTDRSGHLRAFDGAEKPD